MNEPRLENIEDYNTLKGEKKRVVWAVILAGLLMGVIYSVAYSLYDNKEDAIPVEKTLRTIPMK
ncbi:hypothetical protein KKG72_07990 [bacterium]|nr:hypothetical protein [bacterium]MBU1994575.1 hypothetical protein [bacterium]